MVIIYLVFAVLFAQEFKKVNKNSKNISALTVLLELVTAIFALLLSPLFKYKFSTNIYTYAIIFVVTILCAFTDRLNIEARYGLNPSVFSMLKQLSTVFMVIFGLVFLKEKWVFKKIIGAILILFSNIMLSINKDGKFEFNKYFIMSFISNFLFAAAMLINVNISNEFNIGIYTFLTVFVPAMFIKIGTKLTTKDLINEFKIYDKKRFLLVGFSWCVMLISSVKAYEYGSISVVAPLLTLTSILNSFYEYFLDKNKKDLIYKLIISAIIMAGVILIKIY